MAAFNGVFIKRGLLLWLSLEKKVIHCTGSNTYTVKIITV